MTCPEDRKNVRKFLEDLLEESEYQRMRKHVERCDACTQFTRAAGSISSMVMELGHGAGPDGLADNAIFLYEKKRRSRLAHPPAAAPDPAPAPAPAPFFIPAPAGAGTPAGLKVVVGVLALLVLALVWKDFMRDKPSEKPVRVTAPVAAPASENKVVGPREASPAIQGDFDWENIHLNWPRSNRDALSDLIRQVSADIRYEAPGLVVVRVPFARDAQWRAGWEESAGTAIEETPGGSSDRLYSISYRQE